MEQFILSADTLLKAVKNLASHCQQIRGKNGAKGVLEGILVEVDGGNLRMSSTDGYRLLQVDLSEAQIEGQYPSLSAVIPDSFKGRLQCQASDLLSALKASATLKHDPGVTLRINGKVVLEGQNTQAVVPAEIQHADPDAYEEVLRISKNFLSDALRAVEGDEVVVQWNAADRAIKVTPATDSPATTAVIMPIRA